MGDARATIARLKAAAAGDARAFESMTVRATASRRARDAMRASDDDGARDGAREDDDASSSEDSLADALEAELFASERDDAETDDARRATVGSARAREGREDDAPRVVRRKTNALGAIKGASAGEACAHPAFMFDICVVCGER